MVTSRAGWAPQMQALSDRYRCIAWDMPGFGASAPLAPDAGFDDVLAALVTFVTRTLGLTRAHFVGLSVGGMILQQLAARRPDLVQSIAMLDCSPRFGFGGDGDSAPFLAWVRSEMTAKGQAAFSEAMIRAIVAPDASEPVIQAAISAMARATPAGLDLAARLIAAHDALAVLPQIRCPALAMAGADDGETPPAYAREIARLIPNGNLSVIPNAGHIANLEAADAVTARLRVFLQHGL
jgi:pimeloyl-ACP methyl ester carboxylesterase